MSNLNNRQNEAMITEERKEKVTIDMIMEILCTFNQEGLGPTKWWV